MDAPFPPEINTVPYRDRASAGRWLAKELTAQPASYATDGSLLVLGIPRGGLLVAIEVAHALHAPLDIFVVQKVELGGDTTRSVGAVTSGGICVLDHTVLQTVAADTQVMAEAVAATRDRVLAWEQLYRRGHPALPVQGRTLLLVDDGAASGRSLRAAVAALRPQRPASIIVVTPVASAEAAAHLAKEADEFICPHVPDPFFSIGLAYERFPRLTEEEVCSCFWAKEHETHAGPEHDRGPYTDGTRVE